MKKHLDKKVFPAYQKCFDCIIDYEAELSKHGKSEDYRKDLNNQHVQQTINEYKSFMQNKIEETNSNFVTEAGDVENWNGGISKEKIEQELQEGIEFLKGLMIK